MLGSLDAIITRYLNSAAASFPQPLTAFDQIIKVNGVAVTSNMMERGVASAPGGPAVGGGWRVTIVAVVDVSVSGEADVDR